MSSNMKFIIQPIELEEAFKISELRYDEEICDNIHDGKMYPSHQTKEWLANLPKDKERWIIYPAENNNCLYTYYAIGIARIDNIDLYNRNCYVGLDIYKKYRGQGLAKPIYIDLLNKLFNSYNMNMVYLEVLETNVRGIHIYQQLGFTQCGMFPKKVFKKQQYINSLIFSLSAEEWFQKGKA
jgi:RimJ/RimL family protein N-acetyltransferase